MLRESHQTKQSFKLGFLFEVWALLAAWSSLWCDPTLSLSLAAWWLFFVFFYFVLFFPWVPASSASPASAVWVLKVVCEQDLKETAFQFIFHKRHTCLSTLGEREKECPPDVDYCELRFNFPASTWSQTQLCIRSGKSYCFMWFLNENHKAANPQPEQVLPQSRTSRRPLWVASELRGEL